MEPTCAHIELVPNAEFRMSVGNISAVCNVIIAYTAVMPNRASIATATIQFELSVIAADEVIINLLIILLF